MARYDGTLRNARGCIMQFLYGEDGMDAQRIEKQSLHLIISSSHHHSRIHYQTLGDILKNIKKNESLVCAKFPILIINLQVCDM